MQIYVKKKNEKTETVAVEFLRETTIANVAATIGEPEIEYAEKSIAEKNLARGFGYEIAEVYKVRFTRQSWYDVLVASRGERLP